MDIAKMVFGGYRVGAEFRSYFVNLSVYFGDIQLRAVLLYVSVDPF